MGYKRPEAVIAGVRGWHHGRYPAVRTPRARELLTEVQPILIEALAKTADPDLAFIGFDRFLSELPSGVQLFSLLKQNPGLIELIAAIMGTAPAAGPHPEQAAARARCRAGARASSAAFRAHAILSTIVAAELKDAGDFQEALDRARLIGNEQAFLIGVRVLTGTISAAQAGGAYALLAEMPDPGHAGRGRARDGAHARTCAGERGLRRGHGQARRPRDDGRLRPRPHRGLRFRCRRAAVGRPQAAARHPVLHAPDAAPDQRAGLADRRRHPLRGRHAPAALGPEGPGRHPAFELRRLPAARGLDLGAPGADARARRLRPAGRCALRVEQAIRARPDPAARPRQDRRRRARHARAHREGEGHQGHLGPQAGARRSGRPRVHRPVPATRACGRPPRTS